MKKFVLWMIRVFKLDIPTEKVIEKVVEKEVYLPHEGVIYGNVTIKGDVVVLGDLKVEGGLTCHLKDLNK